jgi:Domain of unknown function (DUF4136)
MRLTLGVVISVAVAAAPAAAQTPKYGVTATVEKNVDFASLRSYSWTKGQPSPDKSIDSRVIAAVDRELSALGLTQMPSGQGDVLVTYASLSRTDVDLKAKADEGRRPESWVGTLVVALLDPATRRRLLRLRVDQPIEIDRETLGATIDSAVTAMFAKYPGRRSK